MGRDTSQSGTAQCFLAPILLPKLCQHNPPKSSVFMYYTEREPENQKKKIIITGEAVERGYLLQTDHSQLLRLFQFTQLPIYEQILDTTQTQYTAANFSFRSALALRLLKMNGSASGFDQNPVIISVALMTTFSNLVQNRSLP